MHIALDHTAHEDTVLARRDRQVPGKGPMVDAVSLRARARTRGERARGEGDAPEHLAIASGPHHREVLLGGTRRVGVRQVVRDDDQLVGIGALVAARADGGRDRPQGDRAVGVDAASEIPTSSGGGVEAGRVDLAVRPVGHAVGLAEMQTVLENIRQGPRLRVSRIHFCRPAVAKVAASTTFPLTGGDTSIPSPSSHT